MTRSGRADFIMCQSRLPNDGRGTFLRVSTCLIMGLVVGCLARSIHAELQPNMAYDLILTHNNMVQGKQFVYKIGKNFVLFDVLAHSNLLLVNFCMDFLSRVYLPH